MILREQPATPSRSLHRAPRRHRVAEENLGPTRSRSASLPGVRAPLGLRQGVRCRRLASTIGSSSAAVRPAVSIRQEILRYAARMPPPHFPRPLPPQRSRSAYRTAGAAPVDDADRPRLIMHRPEPPLDEPVLAPVLAPARVRPRAAATPNALLATSMPPSSGVTGLGDARMLVVPVGGVLWVLQIFLPSPVLWALIGVGVIGVVASSLRRIW